ncbi:probable polyketide synthase that catalyse the condensation of one acetyl-CoA and six malonyl-CoA resultin [Fusarium torulosum]|uniref:Probable polyketide synthase that catalyse the condensation of one acetyl-CoA and six malonyl-CoA resultin n=1 Tax=Fusarium torulosum TaxID=33205 RepID=A0AAE8MM35_9HYPO|nr:probable polyketide synthase that catalyse the condensation of one acetyl-CoA and six malonyl-CoA resultin [Fusarium torulosum]
MSSFNMKHSSMEVFVFGDQSTRFTPSLQDLLLKGNSPYLTHFVGQVHALFKKEISSLPISQRRLFPTFANIQELVSKSDWDGGNPALTSALACFYHLASFIHFYDGHGRAFPTENDRIIGLCVGSLAAAAVSCSRSLSELVSASVDAVRVALHVGLRVLRTASLFNTSDTPSATWSVIVPDVVLPRSSAQDRLDSFITESGLDRSSVPYISSVAHHNMTISGPPCVLEQFVRTIVSSSKDALPVPIYAPYHASHLYSQDDVDEVLELAAPTFMSKSIIPVISSCSGELLEPFDYTQLLRHCVHDMLIQRLDLTKVSQAVHYLLMNNSPSAYILLRPVATSVSNSIVSSMEPSLAERCVVDSSINPSASIHLSSTKQQPKAPNESSKIAIVSMSGRFPDAANLGDFWDLLYEGRDVHRKIPEDRFNAELHYDNTGRRKNTSKVMNGCFIKEPGHFDAKFFNISPKEAEQSDPGQRMALETAYEALEMAGIVPDRTPSTQRDRVGVFYGMTSDDWREVNSGQNVDTYFIPGGNRAFTPGRLNYFFKFSGPSASVDTACSSSLAAIHLACNALWRNDCDTAIAGGTNVMTNPDNFAGLDRGHFLSRTGNCNTFDDAADGYCRADGVGTIILKRIEDAEADNDPILGVILGAYTNHSAEAVSITRPHAGAQEYIFSKLLRESGVDPYDVSYIEMHGTGTQAGDATEMSSVLKAFAPTSGFGGRLPYQSLHLGSVKANVGHGESASGVVALIKTLLMMQNNIIPPHCGIKTKINHHFPTDLMQRNVHIAGTPTSWTRLAEGGAVRTAFVNNFSAAGGNSAVLLQDAPLPAVGADSDDPRSFHVVTVSARSSDSLRRNLVNLREFVEGQKGSGTDLLGKLSYTTSARRMHHQFRASVTAQNLEQLSMGLDAAIELQDVKRIPAAARPVGFVFSGQGAQYSGMGKDYFTHFTVFRSEIMSYDSIVRSQGFPSILPLIRGEMEVESLSPVEIQLGLTCFQMALAKLWKSFGIEPSFVLGHSLGHYAALHIAGVLSATDTIYLTGTRAQLLTDKCQAGSHSMLAVRASVPQIQQFLDANIHEVACVNGPREVVISGKVADIDQLADVLAADNIKATRVKLPFAFHSAQVDPILFDLDTLASRVTFHSPHIPVLCALDSSVINPGNHGVIGPLHLQRHCRETVNFEGALHAAEREKIINKNSTLWIEIGPHVVCSAFLKASLGQDTLTIASLRRNDDSWKVLADGLSSLYNAGLPIDWDEYHRDFKASHQVLRLPSYSWDHKNYWIQYQNDWSLTKGDPPATTGATEAASTLSTPSVQRILQEALHDQVLTIVAESDLSSPQLNDVAQGHKVNGVKVCTSSVYADVGLTLGKHILDKYRTDLEGYAVDVHGIEVHRPLLLKEGMDGTSQKTPFRIEVRYLTTGTTASMSIYSTGPNGQHIKHLDCELRLEHPSNWEAEWDRQAYLIKRSINYLQERATQGLDSMLSNGMIYKVFSSLVDYHDGFKGLREVILHSQELEGTAKVRFQTPHGGFVCNPMWIDSCGQTTGFLMNCHQTTPNDYVYVNHGWKSMRLAKTFRQDVVYRTYIRMRPVDGTKFAGDLYILDEDETIVGVYGDITFQGLPRRVLNTVLPTANSVPVDAPRGRRELPPPILDVPAARLGERPPPATPAGPRPAFPLPHAVDPSMNSQLRPLLRILSEEIGLTLDILSDDELDFVDHGVDSLLSLTITGRMREELGLDIDSSAFLTCPTLGSFKKFLGLAEQDSKSSCSTEGSDTSSPSPGIESGVTTPPVSDQEQDNVVNSHSQSPFLHQFQATSTLLQGSPSKARSTLFLLPDGSGSATSYASLPPISPDGDVVVYGLNCPWLKDASYLVKFGLKGLTELYVNEILRRKPHGPFNLGGWSAGGICAYEAALILTRAGYTVQRLILLDSPNPVGLEKLPPRLYDFLDSQNVFGSDNPHSTSGSGSAKAPEWLLAHFLAFIDALDAYVAVPWDVSLLSRDGLVSPLPTSPQTYLLWAEDGVCKNADDTRPEYRDDDPREMRWLLENRSNFGPNGWDVLLGGNEELFVDRISGANHFTMLKRGRNAKYVSAFLAQALGT